MLEGEIEVATPSVEGETQTKRERLVAGQAIKGSATDGLKTTLFDPERFADARLLSLRPSFAGTNAIWRGRDFTKLSLDQNGPQSLQVFIERQSLKLSR